MVTRMQQRRGTDAQWSAMNPVLSDGEFGFNRSNRGIKIGDGTTHWLDLPYIAEGAYIRTDRDLVAIEKTVRQPRRGINVAGAEFDKANVVWEDPRSFAYLFSRGHRLIRLPFLWESIQPVLSGALSPTILAGLHATVDAAGLAGLKVVIDVHNYAAYNNVSFGAAGAFTQADFIDLWTRLSKEFADDTTVVGYGLMNEPRNLTGGSLAWQAVQQATLNAIRNLDDSTCIMVGGYGSSTLGGWFNAAFSQIVPFITDPAQNFRYEAHHYWDTNGLGTYPNSYAAENTANTSWGGADPTAKKTLAELTRWLGWLKTYGIRGYLGEFAWPSTLTTDATSEASWAALAGQYLTKLDAEGDLVWATAWATGSRWSSGYVINFYDDVAGYLSTPRSNATQLELHRERGIVVHGPGIPTAPAFPAFAFSSGAAIFPFSPVSTSTSNTLGNGTERAVPFYLPNTQAISKLGAEVTAVGETGSTVRLALYTDNGGGFPGTLIVDGGTISGTVVGVQEVTLATPVVLPPGWYWGASAVQGAPTTQPTLRTGTTAPPGFLFSPGTSMPGAGAAALGYSNTGVPGAFPTTFPLTGISVAGSAARIHLRVA